MSVHRFDRKDWLPREAQKRLDLRSGLLVNSRMCCMGLLAKEAGVDDEKLVIHSMPHNLRLSLPLSMTWVLGRGSLFSSRAADDLANANDDPHIDLATRERHINEMLENHDIRDADGSPLTIEFYGELFPQEENA